MIKKILIFCFTFTVLSCAQKIDKNKHAQKYNSPQLLLVENSIQVEPIDTLFVNGRAILFWGSGYDDLSSVDQEIIMSGDYKIVNLKNDYSVVNFNNVDTINVVDYDINHTAACYVDGKKPVIFDSQYTYLYSYYFNDEYDSFDIIIEDGKYLTNELRFAAYNGDLDRVESIVLSQDNSVVEDALYDYTFAYDALYASMIGKQYDITKHLINNGADEE